MAFNPYSVRPIGSKKYEEHLKDCYTSAYYRYQLPEMKDEDLEKLAACGTKMWHSEDPKDPWFDLCCAVVVQAVTDYIVYYKRWRISQQEGNGGREVFYRSQMDKLEEYFFRRNSMTEKVFDTLQDVLHEKYYNGDLINYGANRLINKIRSNYHHFCTEHEMTKGWVITNGL